jgi:hypothetical protein
MSGVLGVSNWRFAGINVGITGRFELAFREMKMPEFCHSQFRSERVVHVHDDASNALPCAVVVAFRSGKLVDQLVFL